MAVRPHAVDPAERTLRIPVPRPALRLVAPPRGRPGMAFVVLSAMLVGALVLGLVVLNVLVAQQSFRLHDVSASVEKEQTRSQQLRYAVAAANSPGAIAEAAQRLGLVVPEHQEFLLRKAGAAGGPGAAGDAAGGAGKKEAGR